MNAGDNFKKIIRGGALFTIGTLGAKVLQFVTGIVIIRLLTPAEYGLISLGLVLTGIIVLLSMLGFNAGVPRFLAKYKEHDNRLLVGAVAGTSIFISATISILFAVLLYLGAQFLAISFQKPELKQVLEVFTLIIPATALIGIFAAIFRGFENTQAKVLFEDIAPNFVKISLLLLIAILGLGFQQILWVYVGAMWIALGLFLIYLLRKFRNYICLCINATVAKQLILFSLPLLGSSFMANLMTWAGTLSLGYLQSADEVGFFNAPLRLATVISIPLTAMVFLYLPVATKLVESGYRKELESMYVSTTKWAFLLTLPLLLFFLLDAEFIIGFLFGQKYQDAADVLRVLTLGFCVNTLLGPNGMTLISFGDTYKLFIAAVLAGVTTLIFCLILVPQYGALGAALGTAVAHTISNVFVSVSLYIRFHIHPFSGQYIKPVLFAVSASLIINALFGLTDSTSGFVHLLLFLLFGLLALIAPLVTWTLTSTDIEILRSIERRLWKRTYIANWLYIQMKEKYLG